MHSVHEGISPIAGGGCAGCVMHSLVSVKEMNLEVLNDQINWFNSMCIVERKNKPSLFNKINKPGKGISPHLGAAEMASLFQNLLLMLCDYVDVKNPNWKLFILLQETDNKNNNDPCQIFNRL